MALTADQLQTAQTAVQRARNRWHANRRELLTLLAAGLVETNLQHLSGGDRDSQGFLQQRPSQGWGPFIAGRRGIRVDTDDFMRALRRTSTRGLSVGEAAQAVQRSAFPDRYGERLGQARAILGRLGGQGAPAGGGGQAGAGALLAAMGGAPAARELQTGGPGLSTLLGALTGQQQRQAPPSGGVPLPSFAAQPVLAGQTVQSSGGPAPAPDTGALLAAVRGLQGAGIERAADGGLSMLLQGARGGGAQPQGGGRLGRVTIAPGADRAGVSTDPAVVKFARRIAGIAGTPITIGTGTAHSRLTVNGNVSQHWTGKAADIPATGKTLLKLGRAALIAAGMPRAQARRAKGGLYNVNGRQIIFLTNEGGDHFDHLHIGL